MAERFYSYTFYNYTVIVALSVVLSGCIAAAAGVGAEAGYVLSQEDRTAAETLTDQKITTVVKTKLLADPDVNGLDINVDTFRGQVTLKGVVNTQAEAERAIELARSAADVKGVTSRLVVN